MTAELQDVKIGVVVDAIWHDEDVIEVRVTAWNGRFGGTTEAYIGYEALEEAAAALRGFPTSISDAREVTFGSFDPGWAGGAVAMRLFCRTRAGHTYLQARIESGEERAEAADTAFLTLSIEANAVDAFAAELRGLQKRKAGRAFLPGVPPVEH